MPGLKAGKDNYSKLIERGSRCLNIYKPGFSLKTWFVIIRQLAKSILTCSLEVKHTMFTASHFTF